MAPQQIREELARNALAMVLVMLVIVVRRLNTSRPDMDEVIPDDDTPTDEPDVSSVLHAVLHVLLHLLGQHMD